eukprot:TRINITY_DN10734_c0_g1_i2.p1 TRINITY_DN10734_c0_g1~~TRINITY_DN10734_c0_g1_i2.p1  ORF type:complete len:336 (+),score=57.41 TRINITY_DN10734_c0_g1_i2:49-1056(+)
MAVDFSGVNPETTDALAGVLFFLCFVLTVSNVHRHFDSWRYPFMQVQYTRLILLPTIFSFTGMFTVLETHWGEYGEIIRGAFESYCLYCFFAIMVTYAGGEKSILTELEETRSIETADRPKLRHAGRLCRAFCAPFPSGKFFMKFSRFALVQFLVLKPLFGLLTAYYVNKDSETNDTGGIVLTFKILSFLSMFFSFYMLLNVYVILKPNLAGMKPTFKFILIKLIVFVTIFQGLVISAMVERDKINEEHGFSAEKRGERINNFLITVEMLLFSILFWFCFSPAEKHIKDRNRISAGLGYKYWKMFCFYDILVNPLEPVVSHNQMQEVDDGIESRF